MNQAWLHLDTQCHVGMVDRRLFGGFLEHLGTGAKSRNIPLMGHDWLRPRGQLPPEAISTDRIPRHCPSTGRIVR